MPFSLEILADAPPSVVRFGGLSVPTRPFASALVEDPDRVAAVVGDVAPLMARQAGIADTSEGARRTDAIARLRHARIASPPRRASSRSRGATASTSSSASRSARLRPGTP